MFAKYISSLSPLQDCVVSQYGARECSQYPVQKPVEKCASVPKQTCVRSRLKHKCKNVTQNVCRKVCSSHNHFYSTLALLTSPLPPWPAENEAVNRERRNCNYLNCNLSRLVSRPITTNYTTAWGARWNREQLYFELFSVRPPCILLSAGCQKNFNISNTKSTPIPPPHPPAAWEII